MEIMRGCDGVGANYEKRRRNVQRVWTVFNRYAVKRRAARSRNEAKRGPMIRPGARAERSLSATMSASRGGTRHALASGVPNARGSAREQAGVCELRRIDTVAPVRRLALDDRQERIKYRRETATARSKRSPAVVAERHHAMQVAPRHRHRDDPFRPGTAACSESRAIFCGVRCAETKPTS